MKMAGLQLSKNNKTKIHDLDHEEIKKEEEPDENEVVDIEDELNSDSDGDDQEENIFAKKAHKDQDEEDKDNDDVLKCRRYNISLTYDKYYATPRLWLQGYDENKKVLEKEMFEDVMAEHAKKTVTLEKHTNLGGAKQATIHP